MRPKERRDSGRSDLFRFEPVPRPLTENGAPAIYNQGSLLALTLAHLGLVAREELITL